jgi:hypothetical protein
MNTNPLKPIGFRRSTSWQTDSLGGHGRGYVGWRFWIGPVLVARTPGIRPGITIGWTR